MQTQLQRRQPVGIDALAHRHRTACEMTSEASLIAAWIPGASVKRYAAQVTP